MPSFHMGQWKQDCQCVRIQPPPTPPGPGTEPFGIELHNLHQVLLRNGMLLRYMGETKNYTTVDPKQLHKSHMKFWRQTQNTDTASQPTWEASSETRPETRERQNQGGGHGIPVNVGDKTGNKRKQRPGRRTQHPSQGKHT